MPVATLHNESISKFFGNEYNDNFTIEFKFKTPKTLIGGRWNNSMYREVAQYKEGIIKV